MANYNSAYTGAQIDAAVGAVASKANDSDVVHNTGNETVAGVKTFSSFPVTPSSAPTTNYQVANKKYVDDKVKTDVPVNAKFTDTITTINGKTGTITKADIVALGIPAQDTTYSIATTSANGLMSSTDKQNLEANTTSRHTHINKAVIDKFSEVDNKPYYDGAKIGGSIVDLGAFIGLEYVIAHVIMNQLPTGHYTFITNDAPVFMLLERGQDRYYGTFYDSVAAIYYGEVSFYGEIIEVKHIDLRDLMTDITDQFS